MLMCGLCGGFLETVFPMLIPGIVALLTFLGVRISRFFKIRQRCACGIDSKIAWTTSTWNTCNF